jgi:hypothetical protein
MIVPQERTRLCEVLERFIDGQLSLARFCGQIRGLMTKTADRGVEEILGACFDLDDLDLLCWWTYWKDLDPKTREGFERCRLFLRAGLEYEWPRPPEGVNLAALAGQSLLWSVAAVLFVVALLAHLATAFGNWAVGIPLHILCDGGIGGAVVGAQALKRWNEETRLRYEALGDWPLWPFFRRSDYERALGEGVARSPSLDRLPRTIEEPLSGPWDEVS